jgi:hypothetical protein
MSSFQSWLNTFLAAIGPVVLLWKLYSVEKSATGHAAATTEVVAGMAADMKELAVNTNSIQEALNKVNREAGHAEGKAEAIAEAKEKS